MKSFLSPRLLVLALSFGLLTSEVSAATDPALSGKIVYVDGTVTANGKEVDTGDLLTGPVTLKTGGDAVLEVVFASKNVFRLGPNTTVRIDFSQAQKTVTLEKGLFTSVLKKLAKTSGAAFVLRTPTTNAGVRGTSFHVSVEGNRTYFCTCNGSVELSDSQGAQNSINTNAHHGARIFTRAADGSVSVESGGLEDHTDASIETLANRITVNVDWTTPDLKHE